MKPEAIFQKERATKNTKGQVACATFSHAYGREARARSPEGPLCFLRRFLRRRVSPFLRLCVGYTDIRKRGTCLAPSCDCRGKLSIATPRPRKASKPCTPSCDCRGKLSIATGTIPRLLAAS